MTKTKDGEKTVNRCAALMLLAALGVAAKADEPENFNAAQNRLSASHRAVLAAGGLTLFLGDGKLNYHPEQVLEAYYAWMPVKGIALSLDIQRIGNPGYNADRGPASFIAVRFHAEN